MLIILTSNSNKKSISSHFFHLILISSLPVLENLTKKEQERIPALIIHDILCKHLVFLIHAVLPPS